MFDNMNAHSHHHTQPGCTIGTVSYVKLFFLEIVFVVVLALFMLLAAGLYQYRHRLSPAEKWFLHPSNPKNSK